MTEMIAVFIIRAFMIFLSAGSIMLVRDEWHLASPWNRMVNIIVSVMFILITVIAFW